MVSETIENSQVVSNFEEEKASLDKRNALLSEENQILLEQVAMLKAHFDSFNQDYSSKVVEADEKIAAFDSLHIQHERLLVSHDEARKHKEYLEIQIRELSSQVGTIEETRSQEIGELTRL